MSLKLLLYLTDNRVELIFGRDIGVSQLFDVILYFIFLLLQMHF